MGHAKEDKKVNRPVSLRRLSLTNFPIQKKLASTDFFLSNLENFSFYPKVLEGTNNSTWKSAAHNNSIYNSEIFEGGK